MAWRVEVGRGEIIKQQGVIEIKDLSYQTQESWSCAQRVVGKAEHLPGKANPRFVVTSYLAERMAAAPLYEEPTLG